MIKFLFKKSSTKTTPRRRKFRGESILEVVIAMVLLSSVMIAAFGVLNRAIQTNVNVKNRIIALNIAREGIEGVRNIRDTNWLKYSGDRRGKWLCLDAIGGDTCWNTGSGDTIDSGGSGTYYLIEFSEANDRYYLNTQDETGAIIAGSKIDISTGEDPHGEYRLFIDPATNRFTHIDLGNTKTEFHRQIYIEKMNPYAGTAPCFCDGTNASCTSNEDRDGTNKCEEARIQVTSRVQWKEDGRVTTTMLETNLFDFFERDAY